MMMMERDGGGRVKGKEENEEDENENENVERKRGSDIIFVLKFCAQRCNQTKMNM